MTFSICVREAFDHEDETHLRFGVAVTTRLPGVGTLCPFASDHGAVATQSLVNVELGRKGIAYLDDGLAVEDALDALLNADEGSAQRQLHGVDADGTFAFSGDDCHDWFGHVEGEHYTVAGNLLTGAAVVDAVAETYEASVPDPADGDAPPLAERLIDALAAGYAEGGDRREDLPVQSAALLVRDTVDREGHNYYDDLRIDASEDPIADLRATYETARRGQDILAEKYGEAEDEDPHDDEEWAPDE